MKGEFHLYTESPVEDSPYSIVEDRFFRLNVGDHDQWSYINCHVGY